MKQQGEKYITHRKPYKKEDIFRKYFDVENIEH